MAHVQYRRLRAQTDADDGTIEEATIDILLTQPIIFTFRSLTKTVTIDGVYDDDNGGWPKRSSTTQKRLLHNISGSVQPGTILAVMGVSGSGKTTLLDALTHHSTEGVSGEVLFNHQPYDHSTMKEKISYVVQDDEFFDVLTVKEQLAFVAKLKFPKHSFGEHVHELVTELNLHKCADSPIYFISHGEKKRLSIAIALLTNPSILVLDEPISGLDSTMATSVIQLLRRLADKQKKTIILSIHQPSSRIFHTFDKVMLISDGSIIFMNDPQKATSYFASLGYPCPAHFNPADHMIDLVSDNNDLIRNRLVTEYARYALALNERADHLDLREESSLIHHVKQSYRSSFLQELTVLYSRSFKLITQTYLTRLYLIYTIFLTFFTGICWFRAPFRESAVGDRFAFIFFVSTLWPTEIVVVTIYNFPLERKLIKREQRERGLYRLSSYFLGKFLAETPMIFIFPFIYLSITYWIYNLNPYFQNYLCFMLIQLLLCVNQQVMALFVSSVVHDINQALVAIMIPVWTMLLFSGFYVHNIPSWASWLKYFSTVKYAYDASLQISFSRNIQFQCENGTFMLDLCDHTSPNSTVFNGHDVLTKYYHVTDDQTFTLITNIRILIIFFLGFEVLVFLALKFIKENKKR